MSEIQNLDMWSVLGQINQYGFTQLTDNSQCYQIRLVNLRRTLEGVTYLSQAKKQISSAHGDLSTKTIEPIPDSIITFC